MDSSNRKTAFINICKQCLDIFRDREGLTGGKALKNLSYFITLKLLEKQFDESIDIDNFKYEFDENIQNIEEFKTSLLKNVRFSNLSSVKADDITTVMVDVWDNILSQHPSTRNIFVPGKFFDPEHQSTYKCIVDKLNTMNLDDDDDFDVLGGAYEEVIKHIMVGKTLGQYFTQSIVKNLMVKLIKPKVFEDGTIETCVDPTMGTAGFLTTYLKYIKKRAIKDNVELDWDFIKTKGVYGKEIETDTFQLAVSNMLISTGHMFEHLEKGDSIRDPIVQKFDNVLANPPFGIKGLKYDEFRSSLKNEYTPIKSNSAVSLFIQAIIHMLKVNGKCAVVLPNGQDLFNKSNNNLVKIREYLVKTCDLKEIIYLPSKCFENTSIKTCVFYFIKKKEGTDVLTTRIKISSTTQKETSREYVMTTKHRTKQVSFYEYGEDNEKQLLVEVPIERIIENKYSLNYSEYIERIGKTIDNSIVLKTLGEVCSFNIGGTPSRYNKEYYDNGTHLWCSVKELNGGIIFDTKEKITDSGIKNSSVKLFPVGTILISFKLSIGKTAIVGKELYTNEAIAGINTSNSNVLNQKYLYHYLSLNDFSHLGSGIIGGGSLNKKSIENIPIHIPSVEVQTELVKNLDFIQEHIKTNKNKIEQIQEFVNMYLRHQTGNSVNEIQSVGEVCEIHNGKRIVKGQVETGEYPVLGGGGFTSFYTNEYSREGKTCKISREGMSLHNCVMLLNEKYYLNSQAFTISSKNEHIVINEYLWYYLDNIKEKVFNCGRGTAQKAIDIEEFKIIKLPIPSIERQNQIVQFCDKKNALIKSLEEDIEESNVLSKQIMDSITNY
uniref:site-specific DNA-methyltransferase (adenine-specific) n=1 Tax=Pyramimonas orientalis virus TaxID=455367 RepID=A0A7M3UNR8_POV01|nr:hypothetical protein HWQ62_00210 [Pyramimonas orientalis virus]